MDLEKSNSADSFLGTIAEKLGAVARASTVFGEPVERQGVTVIPVAQARWGFGGGVGHGHDGEGAGGGGGVQVTPVGFIEIKNDKAEFRAIRQLSTPLLILGGISSLLLFRQLKRLL